MAKGIKTGGGSRKGIPNKATAAQAAKIAKSGLTPMAFMLQVLRDDTKDLSVRMQAAKDVAPYVHPKLANIEHSGKDGGAIKVAISSTDAGL